MIKNLKIYDMDNCIKAAKYPMSVSPDDLTMAVTKGIDNLALSGTGEGHDQFLTGIIVNFDLTATIKMWTEIERYRFMNFVSSQSTMHRITKFDIKKQCISYTNPAIVDIVQLMVDGYNTLSDDGCDGNALKEAYLKILYSVPVGFKLTARMTTNYRQLKTIYKQRKNHRLPEWVDFCEQLTLLPNSHWITGDVGND